MLDNTKAPMGVTQHHCNVTSRGATEVAAAWQRSRYGGLLCQPTKGAGKGGPVYKCCFCGGIADDAVTSEVAASKGWAKK
jgi:hypothetical protein